MSANLSVYYPKKAPDYVILLKNISIYGFLGPITNEFSVRDTLQLCGLTLNVSL